MSRPSPLPGGASAPTADPIGRFSDRATLYRAHRPGYPDAAFDALLDGLGDPRALRAVDLGAGTGVSARALADRGPHVVAVEPNEAMSLAAEPHPRVRWLSARAESLPLASAGFEVALVAQAFHWFEPDAALREIARVLRPGGRLGLLWNVRDLADPLTALYSDAVARASGRTREEGFHLWPEELASSGLFTSCWEQSLPNLQELDLAGLLGRALSASYVPLAGAARDELEQELSRAHARHADASGRVRLCYRSRLYLAQTRSDRS